MDRKKLGLTLSVQIKEADNADILFEKKLVLLSGSIFFARRFFPFEYTKTT